MSGTIQFSNFYIEKCIIYQKTLEEQICLMQDAGNIEASESSPSTPIDGKLLQVVRKSIG